MFRTSFSTRFSTGRSRKRWACSIRSSIKKLFQPKALGTCGIQILKAQPLPISAAHPVDLWYCSFEGEDTANSFCRSSAFQVRVVSGLSLGSCGGNVGQKIHIVEDSTVECFKQTANLTLKPGVRSTLTRAVTPRRAADGRVGTALGFAKKLLD